LLGGEREPPYDARSVAGWKTLCAVLLRVSCPKILGVG